MLRQAYPPLTQRYVSSLIDAVLLVFLIIVVTVALEGETLVAARVVIIFGAIVLYEPLLTSRAATVGQLLTGIRVRQYREPGSRISIGRAYLRSIVKLLLGWYSFLAMGFNKERRAAHDFAAQSVVVHSGAAS